MKTQNPRIYGDPPYKISVIHGGPGAPGEVAAVARELSKDYGILEPLQTKYSLKGQIEELKDQITNNGNIPHILIGHSYGAILAYLVTSRYPELIKKLILVGSAGFEEIQHEITFLRMKRLSNDEKTEFNYSLSSMVQNSANRKYALERMTELLTKADSYNPITLETGVIENQYDMFQKVWGEVEEIRSNGKLLEVANNITCPVYLIHGDYDPHPSESIINPFSEIMENFEYLILPKCGHYPWLEKDAKDSFYNVLRKYLNI